MPQNYNLDHPWVRGKEILVIKGSFAPNGSSTPTNPTGGHIKSVAWTSTGKWTVTLRDKGIRAIEAFMVCAQLNADNVDVTLSLGAFTNVGAGQTGDTTFIVRNAPGGSVADIAANANNVISFTIWARRSVNK
ncbi:MAG TPA: hypothetical protein VFU97_24490 [Xanthobacteraceae bacterium]|nr:hypothetical protein [Xanthobacteraceae bacterium]